MKFWKGNKIDGEFDMPVREVAAKFVEWSRATAPEGEANLERSLRYWLTSSEHFDSVWVDETGDESFAVLYQIVLDTVYGVPLTASCRACRSGKGRHDCGLSGLQDMIRL